MKLCKKNLVDKIYESFNNTVKKLVIHDVITLITDHIVDELSQDRTFGVHNLGTFSPYRFHDHDGFDISSGEIQHVPGFKTVKFRPHVALRILLERKRKKFLSKE
jgi:nucleoid DNA-binding protein